MSRFRDLVAECARDELEETQDCGRAVNMFGGHLAPGVFRVIRDDDAPDPEYLTLQRAPELSMRDK